MQTGAPPKQGRFTDPRQNFMILSVCAKLNEIHEQGCKFNWTKPDRCPRCNSARLWGHGYVPAYFDGFAEGLLLRRFRCPDCGCIFHRWQHMRSWNLDSLQKCMSTAGFITYHATATSFLFNFQWLMKFLLYFFPRFKKNLIYFGKK